MSNSVTCVGWGIETKTGPWRKSAAGPEPSEKDHGRVRNRKQLSLANRWTVVVTLQS